MGLGNASPRGKTSNPRTAPTVSISLPFGSKPGPNLATLLPSTPNQVNINLYPPTSSALHELNHTRSAAVRLCTPSPPSAASPTRLSPPRFPFPASPPLQESLTLPTVSAVHTQTGVVSTSATSPQRARSPSGLKSAAIIAPQELYNQISSGAYHRAPVVSRGRSAHNAPAFAAARPFTARTPRASTPGAIVQGISSVNNARRSSGGTVPRTSAS